MISINKLRKEFDQGVVALDSIDLEIRDTEFVALLGPSGCGEIHNLKLHRRPFGCDQRTGDV